MKRMSINHCAEVDVVSAFSNSTTGYDASSTSQDVRKTSPTEYNAEFKLSRTTETKNGLAVRARFFHFH